MSRGQRFADRVAVVTGGASGIGAAAAARLAAEGAKVAIWDMQKPPAGAAHCEVLDIVDPDAVQRAADATAQALGGIDILVASAGIAGPNATTWEYRIEDWKRVFDVNVHGLYYCCRSVVPHMLKTGYGRIVNVASIAGKEGNPNAAPYSASKAAVIGLTKSLGKELAKTDIRVNCITPAAVRTPIFDQISQAHIDYMLSKIPVGRLGTVEEMASMICFLASEEVSFTTGGVFDVSGGRATY